MRDSHLDGIGGKNRRRVEVARAPSKLSAVSWARLLH